MTIVENIYEDLRQFQFQPESGEYKEIKPKRLMALIQEARQKWFKSQSVQPAPTHLLLNSDAMLILDDELESSGLSSGCVVCGLMLIETVDEQVRLAYIP